MKKYKAQSYCALLFFTMMFSDGHSSDLEKPGECGTREEINKVANVKIRTLRGQEIVPYIHNVADLRIKIFREYPYFYEGTLDYEERYLFMYSQTENAVLVIAQDGDQVVGAITGLPVQESMKEIKDLFLEQKIPMEGVFYLGEIVLLKEYRTRNIGYSMYQKFEKTVKDLGGYNTIALCEIDKPENDPKKPEDYKSLDSFWNRQGYVKYPNLIAYFSWEEIGAGKETEHPMVFWTKDSL